MNIEQEIRAQIEKNKGLKLAVGEINNHLSILEGLLRNERDDVQKRVDEAYQRGLEDGKKAFDLLDAERDSEYQRGLDDGWEAARKIFGSTTDGGYRMEQIRIILGKRSLFCAPDVIRQCTINEVVEKLKAYEEKQKTEDDIKVGDEVRHDRGWTAVVTSIDNVGFSVMDYNGEVASYSDIGKFKKTGRHFDIDKILEEMRNEKNSGNMGIYPCICSDSSDCTRRVRCPRI